MSVRPLIRRALPIVVPIGAILASPASSAELPAPAVAVTSEPGSDRAAIEAQPICIGSTVWSAGELGEVLFYRTAALPDGRIEVGYYVFFSDERPWGNNWMSWSVMPALAVDLVYTRGLLVGPGLRRYRYGKADVEGFRVIYRRGPGGELEVERAIADDDLHHAAELSRAELLAADAGAITLATDSWSHHLGMHAKSSTELVYRRCYRAGAVQPLRDSVAREYNLEHRALPAMLTPAQLAGDQTRARRDTVM